MFEDALQRAEKKKRNEGKGERERHTQLNVDSKEQQGEIQKNRMGKTRDLFKKIRYQRNISCKDEHNKGQKQQGPNRSRRD